RGWTGRESGGRFEELFRKEPLGDSLLLPNPCAAEAVIGSSEEVKEGRQEKLFPPLPGEEVKPLSLHRGCDRAFHPAPRRRKNPGILPTASREIPRNWRRPYKFM